MAWKDLFATKSLEMLHAEAEGENRLRRVLGPIGLTSLGVGAIIGAGIFVMTGRVAANDAGPGIVLSFVVAGIACTLAAFCYSEFAAMAPVAGSAYTYAYATLGELFAWIIGWDLILEYAMSAATVAASWSKYLNKFLLVCFGWQVPDYLCHDPFSQPGAWLNLPAVLILAVCTAILVIGIRESAASNTALVVLKLAVVLFVIAIGVSYINSANWVGIPPEARKTPQQLAIHDKAGDHAKAEYALYHAAKHWTQEYASPESIADELVVKTVTVHTASDNLSLVVPAVFQQKKAPVEDRSKQIEKQTLAVYFTERAKVYPDSPYWESIRYRHEKDLPESDVERKVTEAVLQQSAVAGEEVAQKKWGIVGHLGINKSLAQIDDATRSSYTPYGISGVMLGAALVFFAFIGFDSISTHSEEAIHPQRDVPFGILVSLFLCTVLYIGVSAVITGMVPYPDIDVDAAVASAFSERAKAEQNSTVLNASAALIAAGALAGMTSVLLITFLSQARIFLAMARDGLLPHNIFGAVHEKFRTPHISTMLTGGLMCLVAALTPIETLEEMVNIGTLFAFVVVCAAVLILRIRRPEARRPFRCPAVFLVAPAGILVNLLLMFFLPIETWMRLVVWLFIGLLLYFTFGARHSVMRQRGTTAPVA